MRFWNLLDQGRTLGNLSQKLRDEKDQKLGQKSCRKGMGSGRGLSVGGDQGTGEPRQRQEEVRSCKALDSMVKGLHFIQAGARGNPGRILSREGT